MSVAALPNIYTVPEAARKARVSETTMRGQIKAGNIRTRRIASCVRILDTELEKFIRDYGSNGK